MPPTSKVVSVNPPETTPNLPATSKFPETLAWSKVKAKAPPVMVVSASSKLRAVSKSIKSNESAATLPVASAKQENLPVVASQFRVWVSASQSERPDPKKVEEEAYPEAQMFPEMEAFESKWVLPSTSRRPVMRRSVMPDKKEAVVVPVPNLE